MLYGRGNDVIARLHQAKQRQVVALGAAAGEDDLRRAAVQQLRNLLARVLHRRARLLSLLMNGRRVAELLKEVGTHGLKHFRKKRSSGVVIEVDPLHSRFSLFALRYSRIIGMRRTGLLPILASYWIQTEDGRFGSAGIGFSRCAGSGRQIAKSEQRPYRSPIGTYLFG